MELVLGQQRLVESGGSETYLLTIAEHLQRLGHEVTIFALDVGEMSQLALARGLRVTASPAALPSSCDGVLVQDGVVSLLLADRYPDAPHVHIAHAPGVDLQRPTQLDGVVSAVVALNDRVVSRMDGLAKRYEIVRLRQPIDVHRLAPRGAPRSTPQAGVLVSNYLDTAEGEALERACAEAGVSLKRVGRPGRDSTAPEVEMAEADIVFGHGRAALEGMAMGRAVYVLHRWGRDGWVTPESYEALEADGFAALAYGLALDDAQLSRDLKRYRPEMGRENRRLVFQNHHGLEHAGELVALLRRLSPSPRPAPGAPLREMARLVRLQWQTDHRCDALQLENSALRTQNAAMQEQIGRERAQAHEEIAAARSTLETMRRTRRYRLATLLARPFDAARRRRAEGRANAAARNASTSEPHLSDPEQAKAP